MRHSLAIAKNANGVLTCDQHGRIPRGLVPVGAADMSIPLQVLCVGALAEILSLSSLPDLSSLPELGANKAGTANHRKTYCCTPFQQM